MIRYALKGGYLKEKSLSLDGSLRPTRGVLAISIAISHEKIPKTNVAFHNAKETRLAANLRVCLVKTLRKDGEFSHNTDAITPALA